MEATMQVSMWMTPAPFCATMNDLIDTVATAMQRGGFRHVPVVDADGRLIGILTDGDLREQKGYLSVTKVSAALSEPAIAVTPDDPLERATQMLLDRRIRGLPVIDAERRVVGILTTTDLLRGLLSGIGGSEGTARIDVSLPEPGRGFAEVVRAIEAAGGAVLGLGVINTGTSPAQRFFVSVSAGSAAQALSAVQAAGFTATPTTVAGCR
jgi:acetoin utilization protein AcuB